MAKATTTAEKKTRAPRKAKTPLTTRENLSALIGTARKILRKDKGLNGDVDRLPLLTWVMFLKFLDDLEIVHEEEAELDGKRYGLVLDVGGYYKNVFTLAPSFTITNEEIDFGLALFEQLLRRCGAE